jgi:hypothetical protein
MKFRMLALIAILAVLWGAAATTGASEQTTGTNSPPPTATAEATSEKPGMVLPELRYEFDPVVDGTEVTHDFPLKNSGSGTLAITQVKTG